MLRDCLGIASGEAVVVLADAPKRAIAAVLLDRAGALGAEATLVEIPEAPVHGAEPPRPAAAAMAAADVVVAPTTKSTSHTEARRRATAAGVRIATMPDVTEDVLVRAMNVDYGPVRTASRALARLLTAASRARVTSAAGTDLHLDLEGRKGHADDGDLRAPGAFGNLPAGEGYIAPVEGRAHGRLVIDGTMWPVGLLPEPLVIDIEDGFAVSLTGPGADELRAAAEPHGRAALSVAELGIGTNPAARPSGSVLEDEKVLGTIHVALGDNHTIGGTTRVSFHVDGIVLRPTVALDGEIVVADGELVPAALGDSSPSV